MLRCSYAHDAWLSQETLNLLAHVVCLKGRLRIMSARAYIGPVN
jgi:hypothetical protein